MDDLIRAIAAPPSNRESIEESVGVGRVSAVRWGVVSNNRDPEGLRRVRAIEASSGGTKETDWLWRILDAPYDDPPLVRERQLVEIVSIDDDPHRRGYKVVQTPMNAPMPKGNAVDDRWQVTPGDRVLDIGRGDLVRVEEDARLVVGGDRIGLVKGDEQRRVRGDYNLQVRGNITLATDGGAKIVLTKAGNIYLQNGAGQTFVWGGTSTTVAGTDLGMNLAGGTFAFNDPDDVVIRAGGSRSVATVDAIDDDGDRIVSRGW